PDILLREIAPGHASNCIRAGEIAAGTLVSDQPRAKIATITTTDTTNKPLLVVDHLSKFFQVPAHGAGVLSSKMVTVKAVDEVSFSIARGETLGLVGESGC